MIHFEQNAKLFDFAYKYQKIGRYTTNTEMRPLTKVRQIKSTAVNAREMGIGL